MRLTGFQSGLDINQMVSDLMRAQRMPMNKLTQQKQLLEWKRDDYRDLNRLLTDFRNLSFDMTLQRTYSQKKVTSTNPMVTATASSTAANVSYTISDVTVATPASRTSNSFVETGKLDASKGLWVQRELFANNAGLSETKASITQSEITINAETDTIRLAKGAVDAGSLGNFISVKKGEETIEFEVITSLGPDEELAENQVLLDENTGTLTFGQKLAEGSVIEEFEYDHFTFEFSISTFNQQGVEIVEPFVFEGTASMNDVIGAINNSKLGITAFFDEETSALMMTKREAGTFKGAENQDLKEINFSGAFLNDVLNLAEAEELGGTPASLTINGVKTTRNSNHFTVNGVNFTLNGDMKGETAVISVGNDTDSAFNAIKNYVEKYNELIAKINEKTSQPVYRDFKPLSNEERESLSEKQIEQWEEKARSGLLRNDSILSSGLSQMRMNFYEPLSSASGSYSQLSQIGISTGANYLDKGKLIIDEDKLREALEKDPSSVMQLFTANGDDKSSQGLARRLRESVGTTIQQIEARAGNNTRTNQQFTLGRELLNMDKRISTFEVRLQQKEARYWRQFTAMEKAIGIANQQSVSIMSQFYNN